MKEKRKETLIFGDIWRSSKLRKFFGDGIIKADTKEKVVGLVQPEMELLKENVITAIRFTITQFAESSYLLFLSF